jgi:hypothetical protein
MDKTARVVEGGWREASLPWLSGVPLAALPAILLAILLAGGGCATLSGWFGSNGETDPAGTGEATGAQSEAAPPGEGMLDRIAQGAAPGSATQFLARLAAGFGWEEQVTQNTMLRKAVEQGDFEAKVEPFLLALYYRNGFSVLPRVGEGHQFDRDTVVRGAVEATRLLVIDRAPVRIIFLEPVENVQIVYHQDGEAPHVFAIDPRAVVAVRQSLLKYYLR